MRTGLAVLVLLTAAACSSTAATTSTTTAAVVPPATVTSSAAQTTSTTTAEITSSNTQLEAVVRGIGDAYYEDLGNPGYDVAHYALDLAFDPGTNTLVATAVITAVAIETLDTFNLDFAQLSVDGVRVDGAEAAFARIREELTIAPVEPIASGETFVVEVTYHGAPHPKLSPALPFPVGWTNTESGQSYVAAEPDAAHTWFPANDHPLDKATFSFRITVPQGVTAAANGSLVEQIPAAEGVTWIWELSSPMAPYLATVVIGEFDIVIDEASSEVAGIPIRNVLPAGSSSSDWPALGRQGEMILFLEGLFGPFPFATYGIAIVDEFPTALENQTLSIFGPQSVNEAILVHELAHQWFGDSVSLGQWSDIWLNEGFASYAQWLWTERETTSRQLELLIGDERDLFAALPGVVPPGSPESSDLFNAAVYRVGAFALHALRLTVGDDAFFTTLRTYAERFRDGSATTPDFIAVAEAVSGMDLGELFERWLFDEAIPQFPAR